MSTARKEKRTLWPRVREVVNHGEKLWMVDGRKNGKGKRYFYDSAAVADQKADDLRNEQKTGGSEAVTFSARLRAEAQDAAKALAEVGATIPEAVKFFLKHAKPPSGPKTVAE